MNSADQLTERLRDLSADYARHGSGIPKQWYEDLSALRTAAVAACRTELVQAIDAMPKSDFKSPYWVL